MFEELTGEHSENRGAMQAEIMNNLRLDRFRISRPLGRFRRSEIELGTAELPGSVKAEILSGV